ncbi:MAG TPA: hypothetical protein ENK83_04620 [Aliiroseovarius sp.]|nr:hypothetical protein [Aliiroseovarius sp.]
MAQVRVHLWSALRAHAGGAESVEVDAGTIGEMLTALRATYPGLAPALDAGVSVSINGRLIANSRTEPVAPEQEIYLLQRIKGG